MTECRCNLTCPAIALAVLVATTARSQAGPQRSRLGPPAWTDIVSHGELVRSGYDERLGYDAAEPVLLIQGRSSGTGDGPYQALSWKLGTIRQTSSGGESAGPANGRQSRSVGL